MQPQRTDQCPTPSDPDGRRDDERCSCHETGRVEYSEVPDTTDRSVYLKATLSGKGDMK